MVIDSPSNRYLVLDPSRNVHSILPKKSAWTNSYWGAGTAAHMMLEVWPWIQLIGWEIDPTIIELSRDYFGMSSLEKATELGGSLSALLLIYLLMEKSYLSYKKTSRILCSRDSRVRENISVFKNTLAETWLEIAKKLMPDGRIMVNCGGADTPVSLAADTGVSSWVQNPTIKALCSAFPGQVYIRPSVCI
uniref:PABS domain-containing protein n=1 Tax=Aegilops tauschii TaxID=37682 RepID=M8AVJ6_AEGTA